MNTKEVSSNKVINKLYNLEYWISNKHESTIMYAKSSSQCFSMGNILKKTDSRYKMGSFKNKEVYALHLGSSSWESKDSKIIKLFNLLLDGLNKNTVIAKKIKELDDFYSGLAKTDYVNITDIQTKKILDFINNNPNCKIYNNANNTTKLYNKFNSILKNQNKQAEIESNEIRKKLYDKILNC